MKRILHLISSVQGNESYSTRLSKAIVGKVLEKYPGSIVEEVDLNESNVPHLNTATLMSMFTPGDQLTEEGKAALSYSDEAIRQLFASDILVVGAPLYNYTIPGTLRAWLDQITRAGVTFGYGETGPVGKVTGKKVYVAMSSGGVYSEGPGMQKDFVAPLLNTVFSALGMTDISLFRAEGTKVAGLKETALEKGIASIVID